MHHALVTISHAPIKQRVRYFSQFEKKSDWWITETDSVRCLSGASLMLSVFSEFPESPILNITFMLVAGYSQPPIKQKNQQKPLKLHGMKDLKIRKAFLCAWGINRGINHLERIHRLATRLVTGMRRLPYEERLQWLGLHSLQRQRLRADLIAAFNIV